MPSLQCAVNANIESPQSWQKDMTIDKGPAAYQLQLQEHYISWLNFNQLRMQGILSAADSYYRMVMGEHY